MFIHFSQEIPFNYCRSPKLSGLCLPRVALEQRHQAAALPDQLGRSDEHLLFYSWFLMINLCVACCQSSFRWCLFHLIMFLLILGKNGLVGFCGVQRKALLHVAFANPFGKHYEYTV